MNYQKPRSHTQKVPDEGTNSFWWRFENSLLVCVRRIGRSIMFLPKPLVKIAKRLHRNKCRFERFSARHKGRTFLFNGKENGVPLASESLDLAQREVNLPKRRDLRFGFALT